MRFFRRRPKDEPTINEAEAGEVEAAVAESATVVAAEEPEAEGPEGSGPWDLAQQPEIGRRVDVGALRVPARAGMQMRMELEPTSRRIVAVNVAVAGSAVQLQAFAAPRSGDIWSELRTEIAESISTQGGAAEERDGDFGTELLARLPVKAPDGRTGLRPVRFLGIDGDRWFLRAVISGRAAVEDEAAREIEEILRDVVVVRGTDARPPRELLPLHLPGKPGEVTAPVRPTLDLEQGRGPEISEVG